MSIPGAANPLLLASTSTAYTVSRSVRLNSADSAYFSRTPASAGNRKTWTWSGWIKRSSIGQQYADIFNAVDTGSVQDTIGFNYDKFFYYTPVIGFIRTSTAVYRDCSAWYHFVFCLDTTNATVQNRFRLWVNGSEVTTWQDNMTITPNVDLNVNKNSLHLIGAAIGYTQPFDGYLADVHFIDGQALTPSSFTETSATTGQLIPKKYTGTFTGNSFWLQFADNSAATATTLGKDSSGLGNNWTPNNLSVTAGAGNDSLVDTPTSYGIDDSLGGSVRGNYCTLNPLAFGGGTISNGNLSYAFTSNGTNAYKCLTTVAVQTGKWYFEYTVETSQSSMAAIGITSNIQGSYNTRIGSDPYLTDAKGYPGGQAYEYAWRAGGNKINNAIFTSYGTTAGNNDVIMCAFDVDAGKIWFGRNGTWFDSSSPSNGTSPAFSGFSGTIMPIMGTATTSSNFDANGSINFGQRQWAYQAPAGFRPLVDTCLPAPVVAKASSAFDVKLYTGNGSTQTISTDFSPDFIWVKERGVAQEHRLYDIIRNNTKLSSNDTAAENTLAGQITGWNASGFTVGAGSNGSVAALNESGRSYVAWIWDGGTTTSSNVAGSITSSVRANASAGFSIVTYTGSNSTASTVGHGLGVIPGMVIVKNRTGTGYQWRVWHSYFGASTTKTLLLSATNGEITGNTDGYITGLTSTVFGFGGGTAAVNASSTDYVAYCFAPVAGYSSAFTYTGNGSNSGPFVYLGFRPRFFFVKRTDAAGDWWMYDAARNPYNVTNYALRANSSAAEVSDVGLDMLSNGFRYVNDIGAPNISGASYVGFAWAENPFQYARAR